MNKLSLILMIGIWCAIVLPALLIHRRNSKLSPAELKAQQLKWQIWWAGNSFVVIVLKALLLIGVLCCVISIFLKLCLLLKIFAEG